jgi:hypothetical protein
MNPECMIAVITRRSMLYMVGCMKGILIHLNGSIRIERIQKTIIGLSMEFDSQLWNVLKAMFCV